MTTELPEIRLDDGRTMKLEVVTYPPSPECCGTLIRLWQCEWAKTDYDWCQSLHGDYSDTLKVQSVIGSVDGVPAGTASVNFPVKGPEVAVNGSVITYPGFRRLGIARHLTNVISDLAFTAGCRVAYMGGERMANNVYLRCGYCWHNGGVLRRAAPGSEACEREFFAPGEEVSVREAAWGDMSGFTCLVLQPLDCCVLDYPRSYLSCRRVPPKRCVSNFPNLYDQVVDRGGVVSVLVGEGPHRVLGFGSLTPGPVPGQNHAAVLDVAAHDNYTDRIPGLIEHLQKEAKGLGLESLQAFVAEPDQTNRDFLLDMGYQVAGRVQGALRLDGEQLDVAILRREVVSS